MISFNFVVAILLLNVAVLSVFLLALYRLRRRMSRAAQAMREAKSELHALEVRAGDQAS
jgi:membrane protein insertase Oxa1/YidC/SpoIIIJ